MTLFSRHKLKGSVDDEGRWGIHRMVNGQPVFEVYPDFHSACRRLGKVARDQRRKATERRKAAEQRRMPSEQRGEPSLRRHVKAQ